MYNLDFWSTTLGVIGRRDYQLKTNMVDSRPINLACFKEAGIYAEVASQIYGKSSDTRQWYALLENLESTAHDWNWDEGLRQENQIHAARSLDERPSLVLLTSGRET